MKMNHKENPKGFLHYWWFRYAMATELYIVEKWERATIHVILALMFVGLWYVNSTYLVAFVAHLLSPGAEPAAVGADATADGAQYPPVTSTLIVDRIATPGGITA